MSIITIGIDLAKNIFAVHGVNENGHAEVVKPKVARDPLLPLIANLPPCLIGWRACSGAHHWARLSPLRKSISRSCCACTAPGKASSKSAQQPITDYGA